MGLDAVVYKGLSRLPSEVDRNMIHIDDITGEMTHKDGSSVFGHGSSEVLSKSFGNLAQIGYLRRTLLENFPQLASSIIVTKVLYSGSHSGDAIPYAELPLLKKELEFIRRAKTQDDRRDLDRLLLELDELIAAAELEGNPIAFV